MDREKLSNQAAALDAELKAMIAKLPWGLRFKDSAVLDELLSSHPPEEWSGSTLALTTPNAILRPEIDDGKSYSWASLAEELSQEIQPGNSLNNSRDLVPMDRPEVYVRCKYCDKPFLSGSFAQHPQRCQLIQERKKQAAEAKKAAEAARVAETARAAAEAKAKAREQAREQKEVSQNELIRRKKMKRQPESGHPGQVRIKMQQREASSPVLPSPDAMLEKKRRSHLHSRDREDIQGHPDDRLPWSAIQTDSAGNVREVLAKCSIARPRVQPLAIFRWPDRAAHQLNASISSAFTNPYFPKGAHKTQASKLIPGIN